MLLLGIAEHARAAARHAIAERRGVEVDADADAVVVGERPVRVDVAARVGRSPPKFQPAYWLKLKLQVRTYLPGLKSRHWNQLLTGSSRRRGA